MGTGVATGVLSSFLFSQGVVGAFEAALAVGVRWRERVFGTPVLVALLSSLIFVVSSCLLLTNFGGLESTRDHLVSYSTLLSQFNVMFT